MGDLANASRGKDIKRANPAKRLADLVARQDVQNAMKAVIPKSMTPERLTQICISTINQTPKLAECSPTSVLSCVMKCSQIGLEPSNVDGLGMCYILPYRSKNGMQAQFIMGYRGYIELARRSGQLKSITARAVYEGDEFESWEDENGPHFRYRANLSANHAPENMLLVFCSAQLTDGGRIFEQMSKKEVDSIRSRSKASNNGPWVTDYEMMARKTVIRRASRYLPMSTEMKQAAASDDTTPDYSAVLHPVIKDASEETRDDLTPLETEAGTVDQRTGEVVSDVEYVAQEEPPADYSPDKL